MIFQPVHFRSRTSVLGRLPADGKECLACLCLLLAALVFALVSPVVAEDATPPPEPEAPMVEERSEAEVLLDEALTAMDRAATELEGDDPTAEAVESQQLAVDRLKELLQSATQSTPNSSSSRNQKSSGSPDSSNPQNKDSSESNSSDPNGGGGRRADDQNSAESSEQVAGPTMNGESTLAPGARGNSVWGHLPAREQESLLRSLSDTYLPEYEAQIRRYYEALAEKK